MYIGLGKGLQMFETYIVYDILTNDFVSYTRSDSPTNAVKKIARLLDLDPATLRAETRLGRI